MLFRSRFGTLKVNGTFTSPILFQGDRLEPEYADVPGQWDRIWINEGSTQNEINYAVIKNGFIGIQHEVITNINDPMRLKVSNTSITNMSGWGIYAVHGRMEGHNNLIANCGRNLIVGLLGGTFKFYHCTFANFFTGADRTEPVLFLNNHDDVNGTIPLDTAYFGNCIIEGSLADEVTLDSAAGGFNYKFEGCMLKSGLSFPASRFIFCLQNKPLVFTNTSLYDFNLELGSWAIDNGIPSIGVLFPTDLQNNSRISDNGPDIGALEFVP